MTSRMINFLAFIVLGFLWLAFAAALMVSRESLDSVWQAFRAWPLALQLVVWLLALPVVAGLWVWESSWPLLVRLLLVVGLAWVSLYTFFPRWIRSKPETTTPLPE